MNLCVFFFEFYDACTSTDEHNDSPNDSMNGRDMDGDIVDLRCLLIDV